MNELFCPRGTIRRRRPLRRCCLRSQLITSMLPLKEILNHLSVLFKTFGVHSPGEQRDVYSLGDGIARLNSVNTFLENCIREARDV